VVEGDARGAVVELEATEGTRLVQPLSGPAPEPGSRVVVGVRPEHFGDAGTGAADLAVSVDIVEHLGGTSFIYARTAAGGELVIQRNAEQAADATAMTVSIRKSYLFDESGRRLR
jgi:lactose/L-arabinose transport system ATP-binding protein